MTRVCLLIMHPPRSDEGAERMCGLSRRARGREMDVVTYLLGDGVLCAKRGQHSYIGKNIKMALERGVTIRANAADLRARGITQDQVETGIEIVEDLESLFVEDTMEQADRVVAW